jgi:lipoate-protein ligase A
MRFDRVDVVASPFAAEPPELEWLDEALAGTPRAVVWHATAGLVAPHSYRRYACLEGVRADFAARGWPVRLRRSGGGVVPQGPGILNVTLAYPAASGPADGGTDDVYRHLCATLTRALAALGIATRTAAVAGSFCDGRWNLAVDGPAGPRKVAGTAQYWRRRDGRQAVLAHALLLVQTDAEAVTARANEFEAALASGRSYRADAVTDVASEWRRVRGTAPPADLVATVVAALRAALADPAT